MRSLKALFCQIFAIFLALALSSMIDKAFSLNQILIIQPILAVLLSRVWNQPLWWMPIHAFFLPLVWLFLQLNLSAWFYCFSFILLLLLYWGTVVGDVPLFLSPPDIIDPLSNILEQEHAVSLVDLGAGFGSVVIPIARKFPLMSVIAIEKAPIPWLLLYWRCKNIKNIKIYRDDFWNFPLASHSVIFAFLSPHVMSRLDCKCKKELAANKLLISSNFPIDNKRPWQVINIKNKKNLKLYCYKY